MSAFGYRGGGRRGGGSAGGNSWNKRPRVEVPPPEAPDPDAGIKTTIVGVGDKFATAERDVEELSVRVVNDFNVHREAIVYTITHCCVEIPAKAHIYSTLIALVNVRDKTIGSTLFTHVTELWPKTLSEGNPFRIRSLTRFLVLLSAAKLLSLTSSIHLLQSLVAASRASDVPPYVADFLISTVLSALPWIGSSLVREHAGALASMLSDLSIHMTTRTLVNAASLQPFTKQLDRSIDAFQPKATQEAIIEAWNSISALAKNDWKMPFISTPHISFAEQLSVSTTPYSMDNFGTVSIKKLSQSITALSPLLPFTSHRFISIFPHTPDGELADAGWWVASELYMDTLYFFEVNHKECTKRLAMINMPPLNMDHILVEVLLGQLVSLPSPLFKPVYYGTLTINLAKALPTFSPVLHEAIYTLFTLLDIMDKAIVHRLADWFAYYLSHFDFKWDWDRWSGTVTSLQEGLMTTQAAFLQETLAKCVRLSYVDRIASVLPDGWRSVLLPRPAVPFFPLIDADQSSSALGTAIRHLIDAIRAKDKPSTLADHIPDGVLIDNITKTDEQIAERRVEVMTQCLLQAGSISFSHALNITERYLVLLQSLNTTAAMRANTIATIADFWQDHEQFLLILLDKWMAYRILDASSIIEWALSYQQRHRLHRFYIWEIVYATISKVIARTNLVKEKLLETEQSLKRLEDDETRSKADKLRGTLATAEREQHNCFVLIISRFVELLSREIDREDFAYEWAAGFFLDISRKFSKELSRESEYLESSVFVSTLPDFVLELYYSVRPLWTASWVNEHNKQ